MKNMNLFRLLIILGAIVFGGVIGAIVSATGYASYVATVRNYWSPTTMAVFGTIGGLAFALRLMIGRRWTMPVKALICVVSSAVFGTGLYFFQANHLGLKLAALPTVEYAALMAALLGAVATIAVLLEPYMSDK